MVDGPYVGIVYKKYIFHIGQVMVQLAIVSLQPQNEARKGTYLIAQDVTIPIVGITSIGDIKRPVKREDAVLGSNINDYHLIGRNARSLLYRSRYQED